jgi:hypothetical protein
MVFPSGFEPALIASDRALIFVLTRLLRTNRYLDFARKRCGSLFLGRARLVLGSIVNAAADGKRLRAIDALQRAGIVRPNGSKTA